MFACSRHEWLGLACAVAVLLGVAPALTWAEPSPAAAADKPVWSPPALEGEADDLPDARDVVRRAIDFIKSHERLAFEALSTYEVVQKNGQKIHFDMLQRVAIQHPERIFWVTLYDNASKDSAWFHDGTFTLYREPANLWARVKVPPTLPEAVSKIADDYNIVVPFVDLLSAELNDLWLGEAVKSVEYIGEAWAEGHWTDHVAVRRPGFDTQIWFRQGAEPFPVKLAIIHTAEAGQPGFWARFKRWSAEVPDSAIPKFAPSEGSEQVEIVPVSAR